MEMLFFVHVSLWPNKHRNSLSSVKGIPTHKYKAAPRQQLLLQTSLAPEAIANHVLVIWHERNTVTYTTQRHPMCPVVLIMWALTTFKQ